MPVSPARIEELERHEFQLGFERGRLALTLDVLTDALVLVGQHGVYCTSSRTPAKPAMDLQLVLACLNDAKELVATVLEELKRKREAANEDG